MSPNVATDLSFQHRRRRLSASARAVASCLAVLRVALELVSVAHGQTNNGTWIQPNNGSWTNSANWESGTIASGVGAIADFSTLNITSSPTITLGADRTIGTLKIGDTNGTHRYEFSDGNTLTFDATSGNAVLELTSLSGTAQQQWLSPWQLNDTLEIKIAGDGGNGQYIGAGTLDIGTNDILLTGSGSNGFGFNTNGGTVTGSGKFVVDNPNGSMNIGGGAAGTGTTQGTWTGGTEVKRGAFYWSTTQDWTSAGGVTLGETDSGDNASLVIRSAANVQISKPITLAQNTSGILRISYNQNNSDSYTATFTGGITGSYGLLIVNRGNDSLLFTTNGLDFTGALTHGGDGTGSLTINSAIGSSVTEVIQESASSQMTLGAANLYTGPTTIALGTLSLGSGGSLASGTISISSGATFNVSAVTGGFTLASGQTLGGRGTLQGDSTFDNGSFLAFDPTGPLIATNTLAFGNAFGISNLAGVNWGSLALETPYTLIAGIQDFASAGLLDFGELAKVPVGTNRQAYFQASAGGGTDLQLVVVPEPATIALFVGGLVGLGAVGFRRVSGRRAP